MAGPSWLSTNGMLKHLSRFYQNSPGLHDDFDCSLFAFVWGYAHNFNWLWWPWHFASLSGLFAMTVS